LASLAGSLYAHYLNFVNPSTFDLFFSIKLLIMIALGGMHSIWGAIIGAGLITFLSYEWLHYFEEYEVIVYGTILLLVTIFLPKGLVGMPGIIKDWFRN
jgi:branched-chain amino acid transport system permease protein